ncbi:MAG: polysaccharide pyruvyl transferase family protein [Blastopirellula sp. JB062]
MTRRKSRHALVFGSLGLKNRGDDELLIALARWLDGRYQSLSCFLSAPDESLIGELQSRTSMQVYCDLEPLWPTPKRPWRGMLARRRMRNEIARRNHEAPIDAFWIGGLLGNAEINVRIRRIQLKWAARFCRKLVYYFGDVGNGFSHIREGRKWARTADQKRMVVALRSSEATEEIRRAGFHGEVLNGVDAALYDRYLSRQGSFGRLEAPQPLAAFNPCARGYPESQQFWLSVARHAHAQGLSVCWISTWDRDDLPVCQDLADRAGGEIPGIQQQIVKAATCESAFAPARFAMTSRYHAAIFAIAAGIPLTVYPYDDKVQRLIAWLGWDQRILNVDRIATGMDLDAYVRDVVYDAPHGRQDIPQAKLAAEIDQHWVALDRIRQLLELPEEPHVDCTFSRVGSAQ